MAWLAAARFQKQQEVDYCRTRGERVLAKVTAVSLSEGAFHYHLEYDINNNNKNNNNNNDNDDDNGKKNGIAKPRVARDVPERQLLEMQTTTRTTTTTTTCNIKQQQQEQEHQQYQKATKKITPPASPMMRCHSQWISELKEG
ncbi:unnamed protein product, partial [Polarella glacialis]